MRQQRKKYQENVTPLLISCVLIQTAIGVCLLLKLTSLTILVALLTLCLIISKLFRVLDKLLPSTSIAHFQIIKILLLIVLWMSFCLKLSAPIIWLSEAATALLGVLTFCLLKNTSLFKQLAPISQEPAKLHLAQGLIDISLFITAIGVGLLLEYSTFDAILFALCSSSLTKELVFLLSRLLPQISMKYSKTISLPIAAVIWAGLYFALPASIVMLAIAATIPLTILALYYIEGTALSTYIPTLQRTNSFEALATDKRAVELPVIVNPAALSPEACVTVNDMGILNANYTTASTYSIQAAIQEDEDFPSTLLITCDLTP